MKRAKQWDGSQGGEYAYDEGRTSLAISLTFVLLHDTDQGHLLHLPTEVEAICPEASRMRHSIACTAEGLTKSDQRP
jgi:hypothetical protein